MGGDSRWDTRRALESGEGESASSWTPPAWRAVLSSLTSPVLDCSAVSDFSESMGVGADAEVSSRVGGIVYSVVLARGAWI